MIPVSGVCSPGEWNLAYRFWQFPRLQMIRDHGDHCADLQAASSAFRQSGILLAKDAAQSQVTEAQGKLVSGVTTATPRLPPGKCR